MQPTQLDQLLKFLTDTLGQGKDFTIDQAPKFVQELLAWKFWEAAIWCGVGVVVFIFSVIVSRAVAMLACDTDDERRNAKWIIPIVGGVMATIILAGNISTMVQVRVAPRVVVVEMVRSLLAGRQ